MFRDGEKHKGGRPLLFKTPAILKKKIDDYFKSISYKKPLLDSQGNQIINGLGHKMKDTVYIEEPTITGLAMYLNTSRETLCNYEKNDAYYEIVKDGKIRVEKEYELRNIRRGRAGDIFALKNFGWSDKREIINHNYNGDVPTIIDDSQGSDE